MVANWNKYNAQYQKDHYDTIKVCFPKGTRDIIKQRAEQEGKSLTKYISDCILWDLGAKDWSELIKTEEDN